MDYRGSRSEVLLFFSAFSMQINKNKIINEKLFFAQKYKREMRKEYPFWTTSL
jgi:hypothetical protein